MNDKYIVDALQHALEYVSGKTFPADSYGNIVDMLNAFNRKYVCVVTFTKTPAEMDFAIEDANGNVVVSNDDGTYSLKAGTYKYTASAEGYTTQTDQTVTISASDVTTGTKTVAVTLTAESARGDN